MFTNPMTTIVTLILGALALGAAYLMVKAWRATTGGGRQVCKRCRTENPAHARYCSLCGNSLT